MPRAKQWNSWQTQPTQICLDCLYIIPSMQFSEDWGSQDSEIPGGIVLSEQFIHLLQCSWEQIYCFHFQHIVLCSSIGFLSYNCNSLYSSCPGMQIKIIHHNNVPLPPNNGVQNACSGTHRVPTSDSPLNILSTLNLPYHLPSSSH